MQMRKMKIVMLGEARVGKTSIVMRFTQGKFDADQPMSKHAAQSNVIMRSPNGKAAIELDIWDTAGQEEFHSIAKMYYNDADAIILAYDVTNLDKFKELKYWVEEVESTSLKAHTIAVVGNQSDRIEEEKVSPAQGAAFAAEHNTLFFLTSAKENTGIKELFHALIAQKFPDFLESAGPPMTSTEALKNAAPEIQAPKPAIYQAPNPAVYQAPKPVVYQAQNPAAYQQQNPAVYQQQNPAAYQPAGVQAASAMRGKPADNGALNRGSIRLQSPAATQPAKKGECCH